MIPIRYNGYAGKQLVIGVIVGIVAALVTYYTHRVPDEPYRSASDRATLLGIGLAFGAAAAMDVIDRVISGTKRDFGPAAAVSPDAGGHIWYVPVWIVGGGLALAFH